MSNKTQFLCVFYLLSVFACNYGSNNNGTNTESPAALNKALIQAVKSENPDLEAIKALLTKEADINATDENDYSALHWAVIFNDDKPDTEESAVKLLLSNAGADNPNKFFLTPIQYAAFLGKEHQVKLLLEKGADANKAIEFASLNNNDKVIDLLLDKKYNKYISVSDMALANALKIGSEVIFDKLKLFNPKFTTPIFSYKGSAKSCNHIALSLRVMDDPVFILYLKNIKLQNIEEKCTEKELNPLYIAVNNHRNNALKALIDSGISLDIPNKDGHTALHEAVAVDNLKAIELLCDAGANKEAVIDETDKVTPLMSAENLKKDKAAALLIEKGAQLHPSADFDSMLEYAIVNNSSELVTLSITKGVNALTVEETTGNTLLHKFALHDPSSSPSPASRYFSEPEPTIIQPLIKAGVDINAKNKKGKTALYLAVKNNLPKLTEALIKAKADVNLADDKKVTPLHLAADKGYLDLAQLLINLGASINAKNSNDKTPLMEAFAKLQNSISPTNIETVIMLAHNKAELVTYEYPKSTNYPGSSKNTLLHFAAINGIPNLAKELLAVHPELKNAENSLGKKPIDFLKEFANRQPSFDPQGFHQSKVDELTALLKPD